MSENFQGEFFLCFSSQLEELSQSSQGGVVSDISAINSKVISPPVKGNKTDSDSWTKKSAGREECERNEEEDRGGV
jgi:hypothetical protein